MDSQQQERHFTLAKASLQQALAWYSSTRRHWHYPPSPALKAAVRPELKQLQAAIAKLDQNCLRIATFGLVSRGKSAVINALIGQRVLETGPLHGVTQYPRAVGWPLATEKLNIELVDTPGLDEIEGEARTQMATEVAANSDLILFIVSDDITRTEYEALCQLRQQQKPLLVVFNKIDLYPDCDRQSIFSQLQQLSQDMSGKGLPLTPDEIVMVAAEPQPIPVRIEHPDGRVEDAWENPPPQIEPLRKKIFLILTQEGKSLMAIHALVRGRHLQQAIAKKTIAHRQEEAEALIWDYAKYKAVAIAVNPIAFLDVLGGTFGDLALIRALARLYGLPMTSHQAAALWRHILISAGFLFIAELGSTVFLGFGKTMFSIEALANPGSLALYSTAGLAQGAMAAYGSYVIGKVTQTYLENGCSWGKLGASTTIQQILSECDRRTLLYRLQAEMASPLL